MHGHISIVHSADFHLGNQWSFLDALKAEKLRAEQQSTILEIARFCQRREIDFWFLAGDIFDHWPAAGTDLKLLADAIRLASPCRVLCVPGNHDPLFSDSPWLVTEWPDNFYLLDGQMPYLEFPEQHLRVYGRPFLSHSVPFPLCPELPEEDRDLWINALLQHGDLVQLGSSSHYNPIPRDWLESSGFDLACLGHIHRPLGPLESSGLTYLYSGCPMGRGFDETGERGFFYGTVDKELEKGSKRLGHRYDSAKAQVALQFHPLRSPAFHQIRLKLNGDVLEQASDYVDWVLNALRQMGYLDPVNGTSGDLFRITLTGRRPFKVNLPALKKALEEKVFYVELKDQSSPDLNPDLLLREHSLRGEVLRQVPEIGDLSDWTEAESFWSGFSEVPLDRRQACLEKALAAIFDALEGDLQSDET